MNVRDFAAATQGKVAVMKNVILPEVDAPLTALSKVFTHQSYFDSTLLQRALLTQNPGEPIVASTREENQIPGYAVALSPSSQTPVAVQFMGGSGQISPSAIQIIRPGDVVWPMGQKGKAFSGIRWGLPFGWLGGGAATLLIFPTADASVVWGGAPEVIFHRSRFSIRQPSDLTAAGSYNNAPKNWPMRFPWPQAQRGASSLPQQGQPQISIAEPTKVVMRLRTGTAAGGSFSAAKMRIVIQGSNDLDLDSTGALVNTFPAFVDITWPTFTNLGTSGNLARTEPTLEFAAGPLVRLAADDGGALLVDASGSAALNGLYVDVVRYGKL